MNRNFSRFGRAGFSFAALAVTAISAFAQYPGSAPPPAEYKAGFDSITQGDCRKYLEYLATKCEGRGTGQPGFQKAADYVAAHFKQYGLKPVGDNGTYFQMMDFTRSRANPSSTVLSAGNFKLSAGRGFSVNTPRKFEISDNVVFVKSTGTATALPDSLDVKGKIVVLTAANGRLANRLFVAGAFAVLTVDKGEVENGWSVRRPGGRQGGATQAAGGDTPPPPRVGSRISVGEAKKLAEALKVDPSFVDMGVAVEDGFASITSSEKASFKGETVEETVKVPNVVGLLEGSDATLKEEIVGIGAHLDHLGIQGGVVYPGADDDGSGSTALLAVVKAFSVNKQKPKRSILFMAFCGEEMGLVGSGYYSDHPIFPHEKMICELQMDMVGRNEEKPDEKASDNLDTIHLVGSKRISQQLDDLVNTVNKHLNFKFEYDEEAVYTRSDHYNFAKHGIPIAFLFSGFHPDYHQPSDTIEKINFEKLSNAAKLYYLVANMAANQSGGFKKNEPPTK